jgi:hypothetical protein
MGVSAAMTAAEREPQVPGRKVKTLHPMVNLAAGGHNGFDTAGQRRWSLADDAH